jgi:hypothetical protein
MFRFQSAGIYFSRTFRAESRFGALVRVRFAHGVTVETSFKTVESTLFDEAAQPKRPAGSLTSTLSPTVRTIRGRINGWVDG